jgi:hypothetical protein
MLDRLLSLIGACGLLLAITAMMPIATAYASTDDCTGGCDAACQMGECENTDGCSCTETAPATLGTDCSCE